ncbi:amino acid permease-domain-containing protein [Lipomyces oligophaga]|uniref:amino acid permease-domain-containing protein n=1 Tax=Lipomyces oligophaga TaxID=45792 RepID=UPI0034CE5A28
MSPSVWARLQTRYSSGRASEAQAQDDQQYDDKQAVADPQAGKMGTFSGVFVPTTLNVLSILMFLRFGFILGQVGVVVMIAILLMSYAIDLLTVLSISAISTNGTVRGGGAYYMIARSLGPEFGGSIGIVFYIGQVLNAGLNVVGFVEPILSNFGNEFGITSKLLPEGRWFEFVYATALLLLCTGACMLGSSAFTKAGYVLFVVLVLSTLSVPLSAFFVKEHYIPEFDVVYSGLSLSTLKNNTLPMFTAGAAGSEITGRENFQDIFGIFFPATAGIFAGASMSGDLKSPSKSIPKGTLYGLLMTFCFYAIVILAMGASIPRQLLYTDVQVLQTVNISKYVILLGEMSTALFSSIVGILGAAKVLQAIARDDILPQLRIFKQGTKLGDEPIYAVIITYVLCQITILLPINQIASFVTMAFLMTFIVTNVACFLLRVSSAPNFRPSFHYFNSLTALFGGIFCVATMFVVDGIYASIIIAVLIGLFIIIHYVTPPKSWGDVAQSLIYHQVRKYLLRLRQDHVKFWRPQVLLFVHDPRTSWNLIQFCNSLKKGALYILGHVVVMNDFQEGLTEMKKLQSAWIKLRDVSRVKAFVQMAADPDFVWGARNIVMQAGLGGMKPNIAVLGFYDVESYRQRKAAGTALTPMNSTKPEEARLAPIQQSYKSKVTLDSLPTDNVQSGPSMTVTQYLNVIEDLLAMEVNVALARGFNGLELPYSWDKEGSPTKKYIDLWPIQMSAHLLEPNGESSVLSTNFGTYTLILQLGAILHTVPSWKKFYQTRVLVFVEYLEDVEEEQGRVQTLLENLRIEAEVCVFCLSGGEVPAYETILHGRPDSTGRVTQALSREPWWIELREARKLLERADLIEEGAPIPMSYLNGEVAVLPSAIRESWSRAPSMSSLAQMGGVVGAPGLTSAADAPKLKEYMRKRRQTFTDAQKMGMAFTMQTSRLADEEIDYAIDDEDSDEDSPSDEDDGVLVLDDIMTGEGTGVQATGNNSRYSPAEARRRGKGREVTVSPSIKKIRQNSSSSGSSGSTLYKNTSGEAVDVERDAPLLATATRNSSLLSEGSGVSLINVNGSALAGVRPKLAHQSSLAGSYAARTRRTTPHFSGETVPHSEVLDGEEDRQETIRFASIQQQQQGQHQHQRGSSGSTVVGSSGASVASSSGSSETVEAAGVIRHPLARTKSNGSMGLTLSRTRSRSAAAGARSREPYHDERFLSFNDLPARAQHLILNDLMRVQSEDAAVLLATLPAPMPQTYKSEEESIAYLDELDVWCRGLPPTLLVHSQNVTVTMAL